MQARKCFGQHFLHENFIIEKIIAAINPQRSDHMLEIGPGRGALTEKLLAQLNRLVVVELDKDLIPVLQKHCAPLGDLIIYQADALQVDLLLVDKPTVPWRIVGNLPYNISTPLLFHLLRQVNMIQDMHFMLQKEVVERIVATPGSAHYGRLSVMVQYFCQAKKLFVVKPGAFKPPPKVDSAMIRLVPYQLPPWPVEDSALFTQLVRAAFSQRRKMLRNNLIKFIKINQLEQLSIDPKQRPEQLSVIDYVKLSNFLSQSRAND